MKRAVNVVKQFLVPALLSFSLVALVTGAGCGTITFPLTPDAGRTDAGPVITNDGGTKTDGGVSFTETCKNLNLNRCAYLIRCGLVEDSVAGRDTCVKQLEATWCGPLTWPPHVTAGALRFDAVKADTCGTAFATWSCDEYATLPDSCTSFLKPRAALNEPCFDGYTECAEGMCRGSVCPRTCQPRGFSGETCSSDLECRQGLFCRRSPFMPTVGVCTPLGSTGAGCDTDAECLIGFHCLAQQCRVLPPAGDPCLLGQCAESAYCDATASTDGGVCVMRKGETAPCDGDQCQPVLECDVLAQRCLRAEVSTGSACSPSQSCPAPETCVGVTAGDAGTCGAPLEEGQPCLNQTDCQAHLACLSDGDAGSSCHKRAPAGASCKTSRECFNTAVCSQGVCTQRPLPSERCTTEVGCRWGLCRESNDAGVCGSLLTAGMMCDEGWQCASGVCAAGLCLGRCLP